MEQNSSSTNFPNDRPNDDDPSVNGGARDAAAVRNDDVANANVTGADVANDNVRGSAAGTDVADVPSVSMGAAAVPNAGVTAAEEQQMAKQEEKRFVVETEESNSLVTAAEPGDHSTAGDISYAELEQDWQAGEQNKSAVENQLSTELPQSLSLNVPAVGPVQPPFVHKSNVDNFLSTTAQPASQSVPQLASQPMAQPPSQSVPQPPSQSVTQSASQPPFVHKSNVDNFLSTTAQPASQPVAQPVTQPVSQSVSQPVSVSEPVSDATQPAIDTVPPEQQALADELSRPHPTGAAAARRPPTIPLAPRKKLQAKFNPLADWANYVVVFLGGCIGSGLRYWLWNIIPTQAGHSSLAVAFHPGTFVANMVACFLFSAIATFSAVAIWIRKRPRQLATRGIGMGLCGGLSTLSAMMVEDITSLHDGLYLGFFVYTALTFICGMAVAWLASVIVMKLTAKRSAQAMMTVTPDRIAKPAIGVRVPVDPEVANTSTSSATSSAPSESESVPRVPTGFAAGSEPQPTTDEIPVVRNQETGEVKLK